MSDDVVLPKDRYDFVQICSLEKKAQKFLKVWMCLGVFPALWPINVSFFDFCIETLLSRPPDG